MSWELNKDVSYFYIAPVFSNSPVICLYAHIIVKNLHSLKPRLKRTWKEVVREDCQARKLNKEDAMDRCKWRKVIKEVR